MDSGERLGAKTGHTAVTIRHATPTEQAGVTRFGVEWSSLAEPLRSVVYELVEGAPSSSAS